MTPEEKAIIKEKLTEVAEILYQNTPNEAMGTFEAVELSVRKHLLETISPEIGNFFSTQQEEIK
jgi:hypothetical protein